MERNDDILDLCLRAIPDFSQTTVDTSAIQVGDLFNKLIPLIPDNNYICFIDTKSILLYFLSFVYILRLYIFLIIR